MLDTPVKYACVFFTRLNLQSIIASRPVLFKDSQVMFSKLFANKMIALTTLMFIILIPLLLGLWWYMAQL